MKESTPPPTADVQIGPVRQTLNNLESFRIKIDEVLNPLADVMKIIQTELPNIDDFSNIDEVVLGLLESEGEVVVDSNVYEDGSKKSVEIKNSEGVSLEIEYDPPKPNNNKSSVKPKPSQWCWRQTTNLNLDTKVNTVWTQSRDSGISTQVNIVGLGSQITKRFDSKSEGPPRLVVLSRAVDKVIYGKLTYFDHFDRPYKTDASITEVLTESSQDGKSMKSYRLVLSYLYSKDGQPRDDSYELKISSPQMSTVLT